MDSGDLEEAIGREISKPVPPAIAAAAAAVSARVGPSVAAILFYGSCRRAGNADGVVDFYVLVDSYRAFHKRRLPAGFNALLPPNVYYLALPFEGREIRVKYAVMSLNQFSRRAARAGLDPVIWARFSQPCSLVHARDGAAGAVTDALANAVRVVMSETAPLLRPGFTPRDLWLRAFSETYRTEIRAESSNRGTQLYENDAAYFDRLAEAVLHEPPAFPAPSRARVALRWRVRRLVGKSLSVPRHVKAAFTFEGGIDYIVWKIARHSGVRLDLAPWQRRHPLLAAPLLLWRYWRKGALR